MMEVISSFETSIPTRATLHHIPDDGILHSHHHENLKSYTEYVLSNLAIPLTIWKLHHISVIHAELVYRVELRKSLYELAESKIDFPVPNNYTTKAKGTVEVTLHLSLSIVPVGKSQTCIFSLR
jgi:hypothetical protein